MAPDGAGFHHAALFYRGLDDLLDRAVPFLRDGAHEGAVALVVLDPAKNEAIRAALGTDAGDVVFADMSEIGHNPARIIPALQDFVDDHAGSGRPLRAIGEPIGPHRRGAVLDECHRHEALLNVAFAGEADFQLLCPYDAWALDQQVLAGARRTHPMLVDDEIARSDAYEPIDHRSPFLDPLPEPTAAVAEMGFSSSELGALRRFVEREAARAGIAETRTADLVLAVNEIATNSVQHGGGRGLARVWHDGQTVACEVRDGGLIDQPLVGRVVPTSDADRGRGLWMANQLCDLVQLHSSPVGTAVRLHVLAPAGAAA
ncbi:MAG TPA: sensor histidine kinase [Acidimicrobiales bacterium]|nr:sensor histidine kinase [Acidimicrobiales bacterium]